jgi:hypothetical protein
MEGARRVLQQVVQILPGRRQGSLAALARVGQPRVGRSRGTIVKHIQALEPYVNAFLVIRVVAATAIRQSVSRCLIVKLNARVVPLRASLGSVATLRPSRARAVGLRHTPWPHCPVAVLKPLWGHLVVTDFVLQVVFPPSALVTKGLAGKSKATIHVGVARRALRPSRLVQ